ncbi:flagellar motor protein MotB [Curvibacter sp. HBC61]|uniref:Flagellar motor protein MotB n=1 Tax=Curvibacter cyanobacteriorum TaxID=3026422 RepID=A0ABT5MXJ8_9BURK|nr:flagellar motor protein MotB [Curvibacter sp. HBC61]MDD0838754.1 flagellar motor protein MotB [Curvibacter sp. HBC61]
MLGGVRLPVPKRGREEGEKPFWISFSDLMSALMVLFLVAMSVALLTVTEGITDIERQERERNDAIAKLMAEVGKLSLQKEFEGVRVIGNTIDFGTRGRFEREGQNTLSAQQRDLLRQFTPELLSKLRESDAGKLWFKRAVVEGYASQTGKYLFNLNLSLERSERVICELLRAPVAGEPVMSDEDRKLVATKFFVGGASFNSLRATAEDSRRIEFKLEFKTRQERSEELKNSAPFFDEAALALALDPNERCPIFSR